jgi:hypothetical protein
MSDKLPKQKAPTWFVILFVVGIFFLVFKMCSGCGSSDKVKDLSTTSKVIAKGYVEKQLEYPAEADFSIMGVQSKLLDSPKHQYMVVGEVTAKNGFGVKSKVIYTCVLSYLGGDELSDTAWKLDDIKLQK